MTSMTTIKASKEVRDLLREQSMRRGMTATDYLAELVQEQEEKDWFERLNEAISSTPEKELASWREETSEWEAQEHVSE